MERSTIYDPATYAALLARIERLAPDTPPGWGTMDASRMLAHCAEVAEVWNGKELKNTPWFIRLIGPLIRKSVMAMKPYSKNSPTHPQYVKNDPEDFAVQKARLLEALNASIAEGPRPVRHPIFGDVSAEDSGWASFKHLDHHLTQFGV